MFRNVIGWAPFGIMGGVCMALFVALIVVLIVVGVRSGRRHRSDYWHTPNDMPHNAPPNMGSNAEQILKDRFAKGEIDEATYDSMLKKIRE